jgi:hypothetical protein
MVIHKCGQDSRHRATKGRRRHTRSALETASVGHLARKPIRHPRFVVGRRSSLKRHCPKLTVFYRNANRSATLVRAFMELLAAPGGGCGVSEIGPARRLRRRPGLTRRTPLRTLVQSPESRRYGCDPRDLQRSLRRLPARHKACRGFVRAIVFHRSQRPGRKTMPDATRRESWQRASGPSSRTTGAVPACTASGCACAPGRGGRSCRAGAARAAAR